MSSGVYAGEEIKIFSAQIYIKAPRDLSGALFMQRISVQPVSFPYWKYKGLSGDYS